MKNYKYKIIDKEAGNLISEFKTLEEAQKTLKKYESIDKKDGSFTPDFYEIVEI